MSARYVIVADVGNTRAKFGLFELGTSAVPQVVSITAARLADATPADALNQWMDTLPDVELNGSIVAGSNPPVRDNLVEHWPIADNVPRVIETFRDLPVTVDVDEPATVGIDRLLTALAVQRLFVSRQPFVVVDSGTATTVNLVTSDGIFRGGVILPGLRLSAYALHDYTARLPMIDTDQLGGQLNENQVPALGRNTETAMAAGLVWGQLGAIRELRQRLERIAAEQFSEEKPALCVLTGGGGRQLSNHLSPCVYIDSLALHGLAMLAVPC